MTVTQLIYKLNQLDPNLQVYLRNGPIINEIRKIENQRESFESHRWIEIGHNP